MKLVAENDPVLRQVCGEFDFAQPPIDPEKLAREMLETMVLNDGIGLAAPQVGLPHRVFVMRADGREIACFNPRIVETAEDTVREDEGCLSFPRLWIKVPRPVWVVGRYQNAKGDAIEERFINHLSSRCYQHEFDHLNGVRFIDLVGPLARKMAFERRKKLLKDTNDKERERR